jgi:hypothetical protein
MVRGLSVAAIALCLSGCYEYRQIDTTRQLSAGTYVRVELTDAGTASVAPAIGPYALTVEGMLQSADGQRLTLSLQTVRRRGEGETNWNGESLALDRSDIRFLNERHTARGRTALAATAFTAAGAALVVAIARAKGLVSGNAGRPGVPGT